MAESNLNPAKEPPRLVGTAGLADYLGISRWTVSRVLNGHSGVKEETRLRVLTAVEELGFEPNRLARGLRGLPSGLIGVSFPYLEATILSEKSRVLQEQLSEAGYRGILEIPKGDPEMEREVIRHFLSINVEGIVLIAPTLEATDSVLQKAREQGTGMVAVDPRNALGIPTVSLDRSMAMVLVIRHLHDLGHRRIGFLGFESDDMYKAARKRGFTRAAKQLELDPETSFTYIDEKGYSWRDFRFGAALAKQVLSLGERTPTALVCLNDRLAIGAMKTLKAAGRSIPGDYSLVGFDNVAESAWMDPSLTTVDQNVDTVMCWTTQALWQSIKGSEVKRKMIKPQLVVRESSGKATR